MYKIIHVLFSLYNIKICLKSLKQIIFFLKFQIALFMKIFKLNI